MGVRDLVNPVSTAATEWWCHSAVRNVLMGNGLHRTPRPPRPGPGDAQDGFIPFSQTAYPSDASGPSDSSRRGR